MFNRLLCILKKETSQLKKHRNIPGPNSLNIGTRRKTIADINKSNEIFSRKLNESKCVVPSMNDIYKFNEKVSKLKRVVSTRN